MTQGKAGSLMPVSGPVKPEFWGTRGRPGFTAPQLGGLGRSSGPHPRQLPTCLQELTAPAWGARGGRFLVPQGWFRCSWSLTVPGVWGSTERSASRSWFSNTATLLVCGAQEHSRGCQDLLVSHIPVGTSRARGLLRGTLGRLSHITEHRPPGTTLWGRHAATVDSALGSPQWHREGQDSKGTWTRSQARCQSKLGQEAHTEEEGPPRLAGREEKAPRRQPANSGAE